MATPDPADFATTMPVGQPYVLPEDDPYAAIRRLNIGRARTQQSNRIDQGGEEAIYEYSDGPEVYTFDFDSLKDAGYQSKYNSIEDLGDGRVKVRFQQPGQHKYDTMDAIYAKDADGNWVMQGEPWNTRSEGRSRDPRDTLKNGLTGLGVSDRIATGLTRGPTSSAALMVNDIARGVRSTGLDGWGWVDTVNDEVYRNSEKDIEHEERGASRAAAIAGAVYGGGYLAAGEAGAGAGAGAAAAESAPVWNAALAESAAGTAGYGASSAGAGGGAGLLSGGAAAGAGSTAGAAGAGGAATSAGGTAAGTGGGAMSGMTASDWINLGTTIYGAMNQPDAPDTSGINDSARSSAQLSRDAFDWFKSEYERTREQRDAAAARDDQIAQAQLEGMQYATQQARAADERNRTVFQPLENRLVSEAQTYDTPERRAQAVAEATADVESSVGRAQQANQRAIMRSGATIDSPAALALQQDAALSKARMIAGSTGAATRNVEQQGYARMVDAASLGRGLPATQATQQQIAISAGNSGVNAGAGAIQANQAGVPIMQAGFNTAQQGLSTAGQLFGQAGQLNSATRGQDLNFLTNAFNAYMRSSKKVKKNTGNVTDGKKELEQVMETPVHDGWQYDPAKGGPDDGGQKHTGPMAEDVRAKMGQAAAPGGEVIDRRVLTGTLMAAVQAVARDVADLRDELAARATMRKKPQTTQEA